MSNDVFIRIGWLVCGIIAYIYFGYKTKWVEYKQYKEDKEWFNISITFIIATLCGPIGLMIMMKKLN